MLGAISDVEAIYVATGYTDLRKGINGLAMMVEEQFQLNPFTPTLFLFCGRNCTKMKALLWEGDGFLLLYKRLENGKFRWPRTESEAKLISPQQYRWLLEGLDIEPKRRIKPAEPGAIY